MSRLHMFLLGLLFVASGCTVRASEQAAPLDNDPQPSEVNAPEEESGQPGSTATPESTIEPAISIPTPTIMTEGGTPAEDLQEQPMTQSGPDADVEFVRAVQAADGRWTFHVTVRHPDKGWEDYADGWDVLLPDGTVIKRAEDDLFTRLLLHPHETEQPFTRSQSGLTIPDEVNSVTVRAHDLVDGFGGKEVVVDLTLPSGPGFEVERAP